MSKSSKKPQIEIPASGILLEFAHDINNLLVGIVGSAQLLMEESSREQKKLLNKIVECGERANQLTESIMSKHSPEEEVTLGKVKGHKIMSKVPRKKVLVIDDEEVVRSISAAVLARAGYDVLVASNGPEGIRLFEDNCNDIICVFLDLSMPYMRGNLVFARLKAIDPEVCVFLMSGYSDTQALNEFESQQILGFIQKPFKNDDILDAVASIVETSKDFVESRVGNF